MIKKKTRFRNGQTFVKTKLLQQMIPKEGKKFWSIVQRNYPEKAMISNLKKNSQGSLMCLHSLQATTLFKSPKRTLSVWKKIENYTFLK